MLTLQVCITRPSYNFNSDHFCHQNVCMFPQLMLFAQYMNKNLNEINVLLERCLSIYYPLLFPSELHFFKSSLQIFNSSTYKIWRRLFYSWNLTEMKTSVVQWSCDPPPSAFSQLASLDFLFCDYLFLLLLSCIV